MGNTFTFRAARPEDDEAVLEFQRRCDIIETGEADSDMKDLHFEWGEIDLQKDTLLAHDKAGALRGYAAVLPWGAVDTRYLIYDDLEIADDNLWRALSEFCQVRAEEQIAAQVRKATRAVTHVSHGNERHRRLIENAGFSLSRYIFQLQIPLDTLEEIPQLPTGYTLATFRVGKDECAVHAVIQEAFAKPGREPQSFEDWKAFMMRADLFDAELWQLAWYGENLAGVCLGVPYPEQGWIRQLGVSNQHRRKGLGRTLLLAGFHALKRNGYQKAGLTVNSKNPNAQALYTSVGMTLRNQLDEYEKFFVI